MNWKGWLAIAAGVAAIGGGAALFPLFAPLFNQPNEEELAAAIEKIHPAIKVTDLTILHQRYFCPQDCDADYFRNSFEGKARFAQDIYRSLGPRQWMAECGLSEADAPLAPIHTFKNGNTAPLLVFRPGERPDIEMTFKGEGSTKELPDGSWRMGGYGIDFTDSDGKDQGRAVNALVLAQLDGRPILGSAELEALCMAMRAKKGG